ncbi:hypothetical protein HPB50_007752 [Hyalomma asiaticum]|uniref:Uncharacterized protein n=1 Tax=Hyalomma asiaticum TaxID=266040 RepID=A0ACB7TE57_HYAAI|nr:hypothetical protein HPB50_007752 [Hyalomma asiaticum]
MRPTAAERFPQYLRKRCAVYKDATATPVRLVFHCTVFLSFPLGTRSNNHDDACGDRGQNHVQPSKAEESASLGHVSSYIQENALSVGCQMPDETAARKVSSLAGNLAF